MRLSPCRSRQGERHIVVAPPPIMWYDYHIIMKAERGNDGMEIRQLRYFLEIAQTGSFSRAAERLSVSQPALSVAVKKPEAELGVQLFYTFDRRQRLTDEGASLLADTRRLLNDYQQALDNVTAVSRAERGSFVLGLSPLFGSCFFGDLIPDFSRRYPNIQIHIIEDGANRIDEAVANGDVDLAATLITDRTPSFDSCHFTTQRNVVLLHKSHPLAGAKTITVSELKDDSFAIFNQDFILNRQIMAACRAAGFEPKIALLSSQWDFMAELVSRGRAVSILPKPVLDKHPAPDVCCIPLTDSMRYWDVVLAWNKQKYMPKACRLFLGYVRDHLPPDDLWPEDR